MYPEESIQAAIDAQVVKSMPVHWAGFALAMHHWKDPIERYLNAAISKEQDILTPKIGEAFNYISATSKNWWTELT